MDENGFFIFALGFLLFTVYLSVNENRRRESRQDYRDDLAYQRMLNERREFGYKNVDKTLRNQPRRFRRK